MVSLRCWHLGVIVTVAADAGRTESRYSARNGRVMSTARRRARSQNRRHRLGTGTCCIASQGLRLFLRLPAEEGGSPGKGGEDIPVTPSMTGSGRCSVSTAIAGVRSSEDGCTRGGMTMGVLVDAA